ncbi:MAG: hypothetical protein Q4F96_02645 [Bacillota bacterium]|nr:hypothetical protein [Bacillota bacterium]
MRNTNRENMMNAGRATMTMLAGLDNRTMMAAAEMNMRSICSDEEARNQAINNLVDERSAAADDYSL